jgi:hypothetical protein
MRSGLVAGVTRLELSVKSSFAIIVVSLDDGDSTKDGLAARVLNEIEDVFILSC